MGNPPPRSQSLRVQLSLAFVAVAFLSVAVVAFWRGRSTPGKLPKSTNGFRRGDVPWLADQPVTVREGFFRAINPPLFVLSQRLFQADFNRSLWLAGGTAGLLAVAVRSRARPATVTPPSGTARRGDTSRRW